ncbi:MBL fold metallo-hydrolase [bacterium]|nr:MBL fold metallo-hydrolase [bacterium]
MKRLALLLILLAASGCDRILQRQVEKGIERDTALLESPDMTVILCGTGSPLADPQRAGACTAVIAGGQLVMVDAGPGSWETLDLTKVPTGKLSAVLLTHFHSDHIGDLGEAITQSWIAGRDAPLDVYGPIGTKRVVDGFDEAYSQDADYRTLHHDEQHMPRAAAPALAHEIPLGEAADADAVVFERNGLKVTMFRVLHDPVKPAVGYRFDYKGNVVVISGDTAKSASVIEHARGADLLIHEALSREMMGRIAAIVSQHDPRLGKMANDTLGYHTSPVEAAEVARDAGVKTLVFSHVVPGPRNVIMRRMFLAGVDDVFKGEVILGEDGQRFTLPPKR